mgnify:FL=1|tara:strand:- start:2183 stop:3109 length:927 start_codon:yes stop_codon:yes gene_type:complete
MNEIFQKTIKRPFSFKGVGLHSGEISSVKVLPAEANSGINFVRVDLKKDNLIAANFKNVSSTQLCTVLKNKSDAHVSTVEHLMAAFYIEGVDNAIVEIDNAEVPIMDGSSNDFINMLRKSGVKNQNAKRKFLKIIKEIVFTDKEKLISILPNNLGLKVEYELNYKNKVIGNQKNQVEFFSQNLSEIYSSRTFCLFEDVEKMKKLGFAKGGSLENAIVVKEDKILNDKGLRNTKEFVNHKILDLSGDLYLSGYRILGKIKTKCGGHLINNSFLKKIFSDRNNYTIINFENDEIFKKEVVFPTRKIAVNA